MNHVYVKQYSECFQAIECYCCCSRVDKARKIKYIKFPLCLFVFMSAKRKKNKKASPITIQAINMTQVHLHKFRLRCICQMDTLGIVEQLEKWTKTISIYLLLSKKKKNSLLKMNEIPSSIRCTYLNNFPISNYIQREF